MGAALPLGCRSGGCRRCHPRAPAARQRAELGASTVGAAAAILGLQPRASGPSWGPRRWAPRCRWGCRSGGFRRCLPRARQRGRAAVVRRARQRAELGASTMGAALPLGLPFRWVPSLPSSGSSRAPAVPSWGASTMGAALPLGLPFRWALPLPSWCAPVARAAVVRRARQRAELWGPRTVGAALPLGLPFRWVPSLPSSRSSRAPAGRAGSLDDGRRAAVGAAVPVGAVAAILARASGPSCRCPTRAPAGRAGGLDDGRRAAVGAAVPVGAVAAILGLQPRASGPSWEPRRWAPRCRWGCRSGGCRRCLPGARQRPELPLSDARASGPSWGGSTVGAALPLGLPFRWVPSLPSWRAPAARAAVVRRTRASGAEQGGSTVGAALPLGLPFR